MNPSLGRLGLAVLGFGFALYRKRKKASPDLSETQSGHIIDAHIILDAMEVDLDQLKRTKRCIDKFEILNEMQRRVGQISAHISETKDKKIRQRLLNDSHNLLREAGKSFSFRCDVIPRDPSENPFDKEEKSIPELPN